MINSFVIKETTFTRVKTDPRCFILLTKSSMKFQFCQLDTGTHEWVEEWDYDYNLFKYQCYKPRLKSEIEAEAAEKKQIQKEFKEHVNEIKVEIVKKAREDVKKKVHVQDEIKLQTKIEKAKQFSFKAIEKEVKLEHLLEEEEETREEEETNEIKIQIEHEEKKNECLIKAIKEKQTEDQFNISKAHTEESIDNIEKDTKKAIITKRIEIKKRLVDMRNKQS